MAKIIIVDLRKLWEMNRGTNITRQSPICSSIEADVLFTAPPFRMRSYCRDAGDSNIKRERSSGELW
jgi:hypothetical protein